MPKKKRKGRPSLLDLQKQQKTPNFANPNSPNAFQNSNYDDENAQKKQRIVFGDRITDETVLKGTDTAHGSQLVGSGPTTPLPDKKLLVIILDKLQKKDKHGVFAEPVDPEELPDYHDIIEHPMDFATVRKKLDGVLYSNLEDFERDVFLICSNAMKYNSPATIYFRQARSMQELAKKDFENLRRESENNEIQPKVVRRGRPPGKSSKISLAGSPSEPVAPETSSEITPASGDKGNLANGYNLRKKQGSYKPWFIHSPYNGEMYASSLSEWEKEFPASVVKAVMKYGKQMPTPEESRRETYNTSVNHGPELSILTDLGGGPRQLTGNDVQIKNDYTGSLLRFTENLGPFVAKIVKKKIERIAPQGLNFGSGGIGGNDTSNGHWPSSSYIPQESSNVISDKDLHGISTSAMSGSNIMYRIPTAGATNATEKGISYSESKQGVRESDPQNHIVNSGINGYGGRNFPSQSDFAQSMRHYPILASNHGSSEGSLPKGLTYLHSGNSSSLGM